METAVSTILIILALGILYGAINIDRNTVRAPTDYSSLMQDSMEFLRKLKRGASHNMESISNKRRILAYQKLAKDRSEQIHETSDKLLQDMRKEDAETKSLFDKVDEIQVNLQTNLESMKENVEVNYTAELERIKEVFGVLNEVESKLKSSKQMISKESDRIDANSESIKKVLEAVGY